MKNFIWGKNKCSVALVFIYFDSLPLSIIYNKNKLYKTFDCWSRDMLNFDILEKGVGLDFPPHFIYGFSRKMFLMFYSTNWLNFIAWLSCQKLPQTLECTFNIKVQTLIVICSEKWKVLVMKHFLLKNYLKIDIRRHVKRHDFFQVFWKHVNFCWKWHKTIQFGWVQNWMHPRQAAPVSLLSWIPFGSALFN